MSAKTTLTLHGRKVVGGVAEGEALVTHDTISGWGGVNPMTGTIIETRHELHGQSFKDKVLVFPGRQRLLRLVRSLPPHATHGHRPEGADLQ